jgi:CHAD domain-containing protein
MHTFPPDLLARPVAQGARLVALGFLDDAADAARRLDDPRDAEALHDFRVALRRLRSTLRVYRAALHGSAGHKVRGRLREIARATNAGRDAEVQLAWLRPLGERLTTRERTGWRWLVAQIEGQRSEHAERVLASVRKAFAGAARQLRKGLSVYRQAVPGDAPIPEQPFALAVGEALTKGAGELDQHLAEIQSVEQHDVIHQARIAAKRLRYVLEPVADRTADGPGVLERLKALQDLLGELCDCFVLDEALRREVEAAGAERARRLFDLALTGDRGARRAAARRAGANPGLLAVARLLAARTTELYARLRTTWLGGEDLFGGLVATARPRPEGHHPASLGPHRPRMGARRRRPWIEREVEET